MKVVAFCGSPRKGGNTERLLEAALAPIRAAGIAGELVKIGGHRVRGCSACGVCKERSDGRCSFDDDPINGWIEAMRGADGILIGSPVYFSDLTTETKALIDRAGYVSRANGHFLRRKVGAAVAAVRRAGAIHTLDSINHFFLISGMYVPGSSYWNLGIGREKGDVDGDAEGLQTMRDLGENFAHLLHRLSA